MTLQHPFHQQGLHALARSGPTCLEDAHRTETPPPSRTNHFGIVPLLELCLAGPLLGPQASISAAPSSQLCCLASARPAFRRPSSLSAAPPQPRLLRPRRTGKRTRLRHRPPQPQGIRRREGRDPDIARQGYSRHRPLCLLAIAPFLFLRGSSTAALSLRCVLSPKTGARIAMVRGRGGRVLHLVPRHRYFPLRPFYLFFEPFTSPLTWSSFACRSAPRQPWPPPPPAADVFPAGHGARPCLDPGHGSPAALGPCPGSRFRPRPSARAASSAARIFSIAGATSLRRYRPRTREAARCFSSLDFGQQRATGPRSRSVHPGWPLLPLCVTSLDVPPCGPGVLCNGRSVRKQGATGSVP